MKKKLLIISFITLLLPCKISYEQNLFVNTYGIGANPNLSLVCSEQTFFSIMNIGAGTLIAMKTDSIGNIFWSNKIDISNTSYFFPAGIAQSEDGGFLILLNITLISITPTYQTVIKLDNDGNFLWTHSYVLGSGIGAYSIIKNNDNGFMFIGGGCNGGDYVIKCNQYGTIIWQKQYTPTGNGIAYDIASHNFNRFVVSGRSLYDLLFYEIDILGNLYWRSVISFANTGAGAKSIKPTIDGGYIGTGPAQYVPGHNNDAFIIKIDSVGVPVWLKVYSVNNETISKDIIETSDNSILMVGFTDTSIWKGLIVKTDNLGNLKFAKCETVPFYNDYCSINIQSDSTVLITGIRDGLFYMAVADTALESLCSIASLNVHEYIPSVSYNYYSYTPFDLSFTLDSLPISYVPEALVKTTLCEYTSIDEPSLFNNESYVYPNPFSLVTTLQTEKIFECATLTVYNYLGQEVKEVKNISGQTITLHRANLPSGLYFLYITQDNKTFLTQKIVIVDE